MSNTARSPFTTDIKKLAFRNWEGKEIGFAPQKVQFKVWQSIFTKTMSIELLMSESVDLIRNVPLRGGETIILEWQTPGQDLFSAEFILHSIVGLEPDELRRGRTYTIYGVGEPAMMNKKKLVSRAFKGTCSDIVTKIAQEYLGIGEVTTSDTPTEIQFIAPTVPPFRAIDMVSAYGAKGSEDGTLLFYQTQNGFFYRSITDIVENAAEHEYKLTNVQTEATDEIDLFRIVEMTEPKRSQFTDMYNKGIVQNTLYQINPFTRKVEIKHTKREDAVKSPLAIEDEVKPNILDKYRTENPGAELPPSATYFRFDETAFGLPQTDVLTTFGPSLSLISMLKTNTTTIVVPVNTSVQVGDKIKIEGATQDALDRVEIDPQLDPWFLVTSICYTFAVDSQTYMTVDLSRDGAAAPIDTSKMA